VNLAERLLKKIPQYTRSSRHLRSVIEHGSPRKWANLVRVETERVRHRIDVKGHPYLLILDPCNFCNLRCPLCPTGLENLGRTQSMLSLDCFKRYFDPHAPYLFEVYLHNWGESLMNPQLFDMVRHAQASNVGTNLSSNLVIATPEHLDAMVDSGLEYLVVSLDGVDQSSYEPYRVRGEFDRVVSNMSDLLRRRAARGSKTPVVEWQYIVMKHNEHRVAEAQAMADKLGVDLIRFIPVGLPYEERRNWPQMAAQWYPTSLQGMAGDHAGSEQQFGQGTRPEPCFYLYRSMVVNADGGVSPCCIVHRQDRDFAQLDERFDDVMAVWNNDRFRSARSLYAAGDVPDRVRTVCDGCDIFQRHPTKQRKARIPPVVVAQAEAAATSQRTDG
jgi:MoaA/NifB/PqqE/SkfB family radical SAM enzyme